jgi:hypothetical protein
VAESAAQLLGAARTQRAACGGTATPADAEEACETERAARAVLGAMRFEEEAESGGALGAAKLRSFVEDVTPTRAGRDLGSVLEARDEALRVVDGSPEVAHGEGPACTGPAGLRSSRSRSPLDQ